MKYIQLTHIDNSKIVVNVKKIKYIIDGDKFSTIWLSGKIAIRVKESSSAILALINSVS